MAVIIKANEIDFTQNKVLRDSFSYEALHWLHEYYEVLSDMQNKDIEFNPISIRDDWSEYEPAEAWRDYQEEMDMHDIEKDDTEGTIKALKTRHSVIELTRGTILIQANTERQANEPE